MGHSFGNQDDQGFAEGVDLPFLSQLDRYLGPEILDVRVIDAGKYELLIERSRRFPQLVNAARQARIQFRSWDPGQNFSDTIP
jgi:hypothetical protein